MVRILASDGLEAGAVEKLKDLGHEVDIQFYEPEQLAEAVTKYNCLIVRSATKVREPIIDAAAAKGRLQLVIRAGVGVDNIDVKHAVEKGITVKNTPKASSASVAELVIGHMFAIARFIPAANVTMRKGEWNKKKYEGVELNGKTLGIVGMGRIGSEVAKRAVALGMNVNYYDMAGDIHVLPDYHPVSMDEIIETSDFITLHVPKPADRDHLIGAEEIARMKDGVYLVNAARGGVIDEDALVDAIESGKVAAAALDVFAEEPTKNERVLGCDQISLTPHIGAATKEAQTRIGEEIVGIITEFFDEEAK